MDQEVHPLDILEVVEVSQHLSYVDVLSWPRRQKTLRDIHWRILMSLGFNLRKRQSCM